MAKHIVKQKEKAMNVDKLYMKNLLENLSLSLPLWVLSRSDVEQELSITREEITDAIINDPDFPASFEFVFGVTLFDTEQVNQYKTILENRKNGGNK